MVMMMRARATKVQSGRSKCPKITKQLKIQEFQFIMSTLDANSRHSIMRKCGHVPLDGSWQ